MSLLARGERYGYQLRGELEAECGPEWRIDFGQLYRTLADVHRRGWVQRRSVPGLRGPTRHLYAITASGRQELARWLNEPAEPGRRVRDAMTLRVRLGGGAALVVLGSDDPVLDMVLRDVATRVPVSAGTVGSLAGLVGLREGRAHVAGAHLLDADSGTYNVPFVRHLFPDEPMVLVTVALREQGLLTAQGNPCRLRGVRDLTRRGVRMVNRQAGAGTRVLLHQRLRAAGVDPTRIDGYDRALPTHEAVAAAVAAGDADAGPGIRSVAAAHGLGFMPLGIERYDLVLRRTSLESPRVRPLLEALRAGRVRRAAAALPGYDVAHLGAVIACD